MLEKKVPASIATPSFATSSFAAVTASAGLPPSSFADDLEFLAVDAAGCVDFVERELPALAIGFGEGGDRRVGVDLADLDRVVGGGGPGACEHREDEA
jgi:hypothetical protein